MASVASKRRGNRLQVARACADAWKVEIFREQGTKCLRCGYDMNDGTRRVDPHHVVYRRHLAERELWEWDLDNGIPICRACHDQHHYPGVACRPLPICLLPDHCVDYAFRILGAYAYDYLRRYYAGDDPRLDSRLAAAA